MNADPTHFLMINVKKKEILARESTEDLSSDREPLLATTGCSSCLYDGIVGENESFVKSNCE